MILSIIDQSIIFLPIAISVYYSYYVMKITDLTVEGSITLGAAVYAVCIMNGVSEDIAMYCAFFSGMMVGIFASELQRKNKINDLLASILMLFVLYSLNFIIMGKPNINIMSISTMLGSTDIKIFVLLFSLILIIFINNSKHGLKFRAYPDNKKLLKSLGYDTDMIRGGGLGLSNGICALAGIVLARDGGFVDINMSIGMALTAIGTVVIGVTLIRNIFKNASGNLEILGVILGVLIYFSLVNLLLHYNINTIYLKLIIGLIIITIFKTIGGPKDARN